MTVERCDDCRFFRSSQLKGQVCRRNPPTVVVVMQETPGGPRPGAVGMFPSVHPDEWCGAYERRQEEATR